MPKKRTRKAKPRHRRVNVYFTDDEYLQLEERSNAESSAMTGILRQRFKDSLEDNPPQAPRRRLATHRREDLANLNQLARQANSAVVPVDAAELRRV